jgi:hypothetical protein
MKLDAELMDKYESELVRKSGLTTDQLSEISLEGVKKGWPMRPMAGR